MIFAKYELYRVKFKVYEQKVRGEDEKRITLLINIIKQLNLRIFMSLTIKIYLEIHFRRVIKLYFPIYFYFPFTSSRIKVFRLFF